MVVGPIQMEHSSVLRQRGAWRSHDLGGGGLQLTQKAARSSRISHAPPLVQP